MYEVGNTSYLLGNKQGALNSMKMAMDLGASVQDSVLLQSACRVTGGLYFEMQQPDSALVWLTKAMETALRMHNPCAHASASGMIGEVLAKSLNDPDAARPHYQWSMESARQCGDPLQLGYAMLRSGVFWARNIDCPEGLRRTEEALRIFKVAGNLEGQGWALQGAAAAHMKCGDADSAYTLLASAIRIKEREFQDKHAKQSAMFEQLFHTKDKEQRIKDSEAEVAAGNQRTLLAVILASAVLAVVLLTATLLYLRRASAEKVKLMAAKLEERGRIARELHDSTGSALSFILAKTRQLSGSQEGMMVRSSEFQSIQETAEEAMGALRETLWTLNQTHISNIDLADKLKVYIRRCLLVTSQMQDKIKMEQILPSESVLALYRSVQEVVNNINKHSKANNVQINFLDDATHRFILEIEDDGVGFAEVGGAGQYGLGNLRSRLHEIGAELRIHSQEGRGTRIRISYK